MSGYSVLLENEKKQPLDQEVLQERMKEENRQTSKPANEKRSLLANEQASKVENENASKMKKKFGTWLTIESIKRLKKVAIDEGKADYAVLQEALDSYLEHKGY
jgi:hypothetical protein